MRDTLLYSFIGSLIGVVIFMVSGSGKPKRDRR
jgi:hypothetical protein